MPGARAAVRPRGWGITDRWAHLARNVLPKGRPLPEGMWRRRHRMILVLLWVHVGGVPLFALARGYGVGHSVLEAAPIAVLTLLATPAWGTRRVRASLATTGLITCSAVLVHLSGGVIEMHFHFFVMLSVIAAYNDWTPFLLAVGYVVVHHGMFGVLFAEGVYNHEAAWNNPWKWAAIHGVFVLAASVMSLIAWRIAEESRARAEEAERRTVVEASERRFDKVFDDAPVGMGLVDRDLRYVRVNDTFASMLGYVPTDLLGMNVKDVTHTDDQGADEVTLAALFKGDVDTYRKEKRYVRKDGETIWADVSVSLLRSPEEQSPYALGIIEDITQRKAVEKMKEEFVSVVSHELRTPLTSMRGALGLLAGGVVGPLPDRARRMLDISVTNADRLTRLLNDILDIERMESGKVSMHPTASDARDLIAGAAEEMRAMARDAGVDIVVRGRRARVWADPDRIVQVLTNLLSNAIKFSGSGSEVIMTARPRGSEVVFSVSDRGRGIPADKLDDIFERFHQVDASDSRRKGGTGLGLAISRSIVEHHGGEIWVESSEGVGTTFSFTLRAATAAQPDVSDDAEVSLQRA